MRWQWWKRSLDGDWDIPPETLESLKDQVSLLTQQRDQALSDSRSKGSALTMHRIGRVCVDPVLWTSTLRRIVPDIKVELIGYELVFLSRNPIIEAEFNGIQAISPFTIDRT